MTDQALVEALQHSRLGAELSEKQVRALADNAAFRDLHADEILVREGTSDNHLYVIVRGALAVVRSVGTAEGITLLTLTTGDLVGELSFIDETPHYASLVATGPTRVFGLEREKLESLLLTHPEIVYRVMRAIVRAVHEIQRRISMQSAELTNYIYKQHGKY
jgi:CRP/FNR family transcriptional regulator, cyclic AMP receptor protein